LICASLADTGLMLGIGFHTPNADMNKLFWNPKRKYRSFDDRINGAARMGLIGPTTKTNLNVVRAVRNVFAHAMIELSFVRPEIHAACLEIVLPDNNLFFVNRSERRARYLYCYACDVVFRGMLNHVGLHWATGVGVPTLIGPILP
jgi:hypothetical protein